MQFQPPSSEVTIDHQASSSVSFGKSDSQKGAAYPNNFSAQSEPNALIRAEINGFKVQWKNDGTDYPALWQAFVRGELSSTPLSHGRPFREAHLVKTGGRSYLFKRDWHVEKRLEKRLWFLLMGATRYSRIIELTNRAVRQGCQVAQDVFLVAEKMVGRTCHEAWFIADFMPGQILSPENEDSWRDKLIQTILRIHDCGLACNDIQSYNFIITQEGLIRGIDLDISSPLLICQVNDLLEIKRRFGINPPLRNWRVRLLYYPLLIRNYLRYFSRKLRGKPDRYAKRRRPEP